MKKQTTKTDGFDSRSKQPRSRIREMSAKKAIDTAQTVVKKAVDILEEEIAAGIIAAKEIEKKVINVDKARGQDPDHLMSRFRTDAHEVIDMLMDVVSVASTQLESISKRVVSISATDQEENAPAAANIPVLRNENSYASGEEAVISMQLQNDGKEKAMNVSLRETDLIDASGERILAKNIKMDPVMLELKPGEKKEIKIRVKIPKSTKPGAYSGLVMDKKIPNLHAMVAVDVKPVK